MKKGLFMILMVLMLVLSACESEEPIVIDNEPTQEVEEQEQEEVVVEDKGELLNTHLIANGAYVILTVTIKDGYITYNSVRNRLDDRTTIYGTMILIDVEDIQYYESDLEYLQEKMNDYVKYDGDRDA